MTETEARVCAETELEMTPEMAAESRHGSVLFYDRCSKMAATTLYPTVTLMLIDSEGHVIENKHLTTAWVEPTGE